MNRGKLLVGNWKMNGTLQSAEALAVGVGLANDGLGACCKVVVCPPFVHLSAVHSSLTNDVSLGAQNVCMFSQGSCTGDISAPMLKECGCEYVIVGHSERRQLFAESDDIVLVKTQLALKAGLVPIVCVGESLSQRDEGLAWSVVESQMLAVLSGLNKADLSTVVWAYEPVWAIGTGRTATPDQAQDLHQSMRELLASAEADSSLILYGGSVKPDNAHQLFMCEDIDGGLIGGASLDVESFVKIREALCSI